MRFIVPTAVLLVFFNLCESTDPLAKEYGELVYVSLLYRHGDRAIAEISYPKDPYRNESYWPMGIGQLTHQGKERHYEFGLWLRNRYQNFLPVEYSNNEIFIRSTSVDRALMSASANLAGLYMPSKNEKWNDNIGQFWQPIPIHSTPLDQDMALSFGNNCPRFLKEFNSLKELPEIMKFNEIRLDFYNYLKENSGLNFDDPIYNSSSLYDQLLVETEFNYTLPNWTNSVFPDKLREVAEFGFLLPTYTPLLKKLSCGVLLNEIINNMKDKILNRLSPNVKLWMYSAHDTNVAGLLNSLNVYNNILPPYASAVFIELRKGLNNSFVVTVSYKNSSQSPYLLHVPGCDSVACGLEQFINAVKPILLTNWYAECHKDIINNYLFIYIGILILLTTIIITLFSLNKKHIIFYCTRNYQKLYHAIPREDIERVDFDQDRQSRVSVSFRKNGIESTSSNV